MYGPVISSDTYIEVVARSNVEITTVLSRELDIVQFEVVYTNGSSDIVLTVIIRSVEPPMDVPVIVKTFSVDLKEDVNYIKCNTFGTNTWVPVISTISVTVTPVYNRSRMRKFSLQDYSRGKTSGGVGYI